MNPVILAGGSGTRLWPMSRQHYPKQFLPLTGRRTMFQETLLRLDGIEGAAPPIVVSNEEHRFLALAQARQAGIDLSSLILEPVGRNTAPALSLAALALLDDKEGEDPDPVMLVSPADHLIREPEAFRAATRAGESLARCGRLQPRCACAGSDRRRCRVVFLSPRLDGPLAQFARRGARTRG